MIDFSTLQGLTIPEGVVTQIADAAGNVLWKLGSDKVILEVEKIISDTYAGETTYTGEEFILLDIYPKSGGTVAVTYGGLTKTITDTSGAAEPNAQQVFFGTFNGVSDEVETPASGTLTIEGDYVAFACGLYHTSAKSMNDKIFNGIIQITSFGNVEYIPDSAFGSLLYGSCTKITNITIPSSVTSIGNYAFNRCTGLTSVIIPSSVTNIGTSAFSGCTHLTDFVVDNNNQYYTSEGPVLFSKDKTILVAYPSATGHYTIPSSVTSIGNYAFYGCTGLTSVIIPSSVTSIGDAAFYGCTGLTSVIIPSSVTSIGTSAFYGCTGLTSVIIPSSVTNIGTSAFNRCTGLTSVTIPSSVTNIGTSAFYLTGGNSRTVTMLSATPPTLGGSAVFDVLGTNSFIVPSGSGDTYKAAEYWSEYADYIAEAA